MMDRAEIGSGYAGGTLASSLQEWAERLQSMTGGLSRIIPDREEAFLDIGRRVMDLSERSRAVAGTATELAGKASGEGLKESIEALSTALTTLEGRRSGGYGAAILERCTELSSSVQSLQDKLGSFRPMLKRLRVLAMSIRIESARMGTEGKGFAGLASQVESLGQKTESYSKEVEGKTKELLTGVQAATESMREIESLREREIDPRLEGIRTALGEMSRLQETSEAVSASVSEQTQDISRQIGEIVSSVQFHDITRQQVEHVVQVLDEVRGILAAQESGAGRESPEDLVHWLGDVSNLQGRQLDATRSELERAMRQIRQSLESIENSVQAEEEEIRRFPGLDAEAEGSVLHRLEGEVAGLIQALKTTRSRFEGIIERLDSMAGLLGEMETFLETVEEMGEDIELIALNASIKSAHTGEKGRPLGVLAEATRKLSVESGQILQEVSQGIQGIASASEQFRSSAESAGEEAREEEDLSRRLEAILQGLKGSNQEVNALYQDLRQGSGELISRLQSLQEDLKLQQAVEQELTASMEALAAVEAEARQVVPEGRQQEHSDRLNSILERYTMESERMVHLAFSGLQAGQDQTGSDEESWGDGSQEDGEDDNVELF